jgi:hypothetical protein
MGQNALKMQLDVVGDCVPQLYSIGTVWVHMEMYDLEQFPRELSIERGIQ